MRIVTAIAGATLALSAVSANAASLVNGSFEAGVNPGVFTTEEVGSTDITGWTVTGGSVDYIGSYWQAQDGSRSIDLAGNAPGAISQSFATSAGTDYRVNYWIARNPDGGVTPRTGFISAGSGQAQFAYSGGGVRDNMQWVQQTFRFTATGANTTLTFAADPTTAGGAFGPALDNVSLAVVPEPGTWALLILGFGVIGGALRRAKPRRVALRYS